MIKALRVSPVHGHNLHTKIRLHFKCHNIAGAVYRPSDFGNLQRFDQFIPDFLQREFQVRVAGGA
jgi:hypothetical protein